MPRILISKGVAPWVTDRATWPLLAIVSGAGLYVGYNIGKHLLWNPEVQVSRVTRSRTPIEGKWDTDVAKDWFRAHQLEYRHKDWDIARISLWETFKPSYWESRRQVERDPERFTASGFTATTLK